MATASDIVQWVNISLIKYFKDTADANSIPFFVEGVDERSSNTMREDHSELRIQGPYLRKLSPNMWKLTCIVNILLTVRLQMASQNAYKITEWGGIFMEAMDALIPVYKYGDGEELFGCLKATIDRNNAIRLFDFGILGNDTRVRQSEVDASFEMITGE